MSEPALIVTASDLYSVPAWGGGIGYCAAGCREWMAAHGLSWPEFVMNGIDAQTLIDTGDPLARRLVEHARARQAREMEMQRERPHG